MEAATLAAPPQSLPRRKTTIRYPAHNYSEPGAYFITICTQGRRQVFGHVYDNEMHGNAISAMVEEVWHQLPNRYPGIVLDAMLIMPDHLHGVLFLGTDPAIEALPRLGDIISYFKGQSTIRYFEQVRAGVWPRVDQRLWQQKYFDRIVRSERELENIRCTSRRIPCAGGANAVEDSHSAANTCISDVTSGPPQGRSLRVLRTLRRPRLRRLISNTPARAAIYPRASPSGFAR